MVDRPSNAISDVVNGITFNLQGLSSGTNPASVSVAAGADNSNTMINALITAYNAVINQYNTLTANSVTSSTPGDFANNPAMLSFVNNVKSMFSNGTTDPTTLSMTGFTAATDTVNLDAVNGYLQIGSVKYPFSSITQTPPKVSDLVGWINGLNAGVTASFDGTSINLNNAAAAHLAINLSGVNNSVKRNTISLASMGMDLQLDGTLQFNTTNYQSAVTSGLYQKLASGLKVGYTNFSSNLDSFLSAQIDPSTGTLVSEMNAQQSSITDMKSKQTVLQDHLNQVQNNYITQYSALNALLFQLNSTSTSLASALTAITNINAGK
jgi:flagellar hook-associated protein 2